MILKSTFLADAGFVAFAKCPECDWKFVALGDSASKKRDESARELKIDYLRHKLTNESKTLDDSMELVSLLTKDLEDYLEA